MKALYITLFLLFLLACQPQVVQQDSVEVVQEEVVEKIRVPLSMSLTAEKTAAELILETNLSCEAKDGNGNYNYTWESEELSLVNCNENCPVEIKVIGTYNVTCAVTDGEETLSETITLEVTKKKEKLETVVVFGDSLSYGHGLAEPENTRWSQLLSNSFESTNLQTFAVSGATTYHIKENQIPKYDEIASTIQEDKKLVFLWVGGNDAKNLISLSDFENAYKFIVDKASEIENAYVVMINVPDVSKLSVTEEIDNTINSIANQFGINIGVKELTKDVVADYNRVVQTIADQNNIPVIDMFNHLDTFSDDMITSDRFHPNELGHEMVAEKVRNDLVEVFPEIEFV